MEPIPYPSSDPRYKQEWSRRRRAELRAEGLTAHGRPYVLRTEDKRLKIRKPPITNAEAKP